MHRKKQRHFSINVSDIRTDIFLATREKIAIEMRKSHSLERYMYKNYIYLASLKKVLEADSTRLQFFISEIYIIKF